MFLQYWPRENENPAHSFLPIRLSTCAILIKYCPLSWKVACCKARAYLYWNTVPTATTVPILPLNSFAATAKSTFPFSARSKSNQPLPGIEGRGTNKLPENKKPLSFLKLSGICGLDGTRTRDPRRDTAIFQPSERLDQAIQFTQSLLAGCTGHEPAPLGVTGRYSNQLNYQTNKTIILKKPSGGLDGTRTRDPRRDRPIF